MPTDHDDDVEISAMLNQAEPPKSPKHLDAVILKYAKEKAIESAPGRSGFSWPSLAWLQQNWMPAAATLSVAAIAVSVSLPMFTEPDLQSAEKPGLAEFSLNDSVPARQSTPASAAVEAEERLRPAAALQDAASRSLAVGVSAVQPALERSQSSTPSLSQARLSAAGVSPDTVQTFEELAEADPGQTAIALSAGIADDRAEEDLASAAAARSGVRRNPALIQEPPPSFAETLIEDAELQESVVAVLRRSLGTGDQTAIAAQQDFSLLIDPLVDAYRQLTDAADLRSVQSRYTLARSERLDSRLPESVEELISRIEALDN